MKNAILLTVFLVFSSQITFAGGYVGNGGGLVEQNFNFAYSSIPRLVDSSLVTINLQFNEQEKQILQKISAIAAENASNAKRLVFLSGQKHPEIFNTTPEELHRLAVTTHTPGDIIYVNGDLLYSEAGKPLLSMGEIISILIHEIGHQTGEKHHQFLDVIGSKLRNYYLQNSLSYEIEKANKMLTFTVLNQKGHYSSGQLIYQSDSKVTNLTPSINEKIQAILKANYYVNVTGFFLTNGNFKLEQLPSRYIFQIWVNASYSLRTENGYVLKSELFPLEFEVTDDNSVRLVE